MPTRFQRTIVTRRHPMAFAMYLMVLVLGLIFVFDLFGAGQTEATVFPHIPHWVIFAWEWMMVLGAGGSLLALISPARTAPHFPDLADLLHGEATGTCLSALGLATYTVALESAFGFDRLGPALAIYVVLIAGHIWRAVQAFREARQIKHLAFLLDLAVQHERE